MCRVSGGTWTNNTLIAAMNNHITKEMTNWKGQCYHWDVVNEALDDDGNFRDNIFYQTIGPYYINIAFATAAAADPDAKLYYNDYSIEYSGLKQTNALAIVKQIKDAGLRIDGVGIQGHYVLGGTPSQSSLESVFKKYTDLGVEVAITELDIRMQTNSTANLAQQSTEYAAVTKACLNVDGCVGITIWDFDDKMSWVPNTFTGYGYACPWAEDLSKKPAYYGIIDALKSSNRTTTTTTKAPSTNITTESISLNTATSSVLSKFTTSSVSTKTATGAAIASSTANSVSTNTTISNSTTPGNGCNMVNSSAKPSYPHTKLVHSHEHIKRRSY